MNERKELEQLLSKIQEHRAIIDGLKARVRHLLARMEGKKEGLTS